MQNFSNNKSTRNRRQLSEINVTPMVDVMLVLLIIFMVTTPMLVGGVEVDLPKTEAKAVSSDQKPLVLSVDRFKNIYIFESKIEKRELKSKLIEITKRNYQAQIYIKGDKRVSYGEIMQVMAILQKAGFTKLALISDTKN